MTVIIFGHNFKDAPSPLCDCGSETEATDHFFFHCSIFAENRQKLLNSLFKRDFSLKNLNDKTLLKILLFGYDIYKDTVSKVILNHTINFLKTTKRFERPLLFHGWFHFMITFLISLLHSHLLCKLDAVTLLAPYQLLQISIFSPYF